MTSKQAIIVAHGSPCDPESQEVAMKELADRVSGHLPGWTVRGTTLAAPGSFERAMDGLERPFVYPFFMAAGYFTGDVLPKRIAGCGRSAILLPPFGAEPSLPPLISRTVCAGVQGGRALRSTALLLAAHGSQVSPASRLATEALAEYLRSALPFKSVVTGFLEEAPYLADAARGIGPALCLPLFTLRAGHAEIDVPQALSKAGFSGTHLAPIGAHPEVPQLIASSLARHGVRAAA